MLPSPGASNLETIMELVCSCFSFSSVGEKERRREGEKERRREGEKERRREGEKERRREGEKDRTNNQMFINFNQR